MDTSTEPANARILKIAAFVQKRLDEMALKYPDPIHDPLYRWQHTLRVASYGKIIAEFEGANVDCVVTACLLHDVAHFDPMDNYTSHGRTGAEIARPVLAECGYSAQEVDNICYSIAVHVDGQAGYDHTETLESKIVSDADNIDRFGAYRIMQWCVLEMGNHQVLAGKLAQRIPTLEKYKLVNPLETASGKALFDRQLDLQIAFFNALIAEWNITVVPE